MVFHHYDIYALDTFDNHTEDLPELYYPPLLLLSNKKRRREGAKTEVKSTNFVSHEQPIEEVYL